jgi:hypothetical protein
MNNTYLLDQIKVHIISIRYILVDVKCTLSDAEVLTFPK